MKFNVICSDPPWAFDDKLQKMKSQTKRSAVSQYSTLTFNEVAQIDVKSIVDPEWCVLALWVPSILLPQGLHVMKEWGFSYKQMVVWVKTKKGNKKQQVVDINDMFAFGMGRLFRQVHEIALIGTSGKVYKHLENKSQRSVFGDINKGHSTKPEILQDRLELMFPSASKLEMFARRQRENWTTVGFGVDGLDINDSILKLKDCNDERLDENYELQAV